MIAGAIGYFTLVKKQTLPVETNQPQQTHTSIAPQPPTTTNNTTQTPPAAPQNISQNNVDDCNLISNSSFRSINQYEIGLGPNGPAMGYWGITFRENKFEWGYSDVSESGTYTCKNNVLYAQAYNRSITAHYDGSKKILTWDGVEYKKAE